MSYIKNALIEFEEQFPDIEEDTDEFYRKFDIFLSLQAKSIEIDPELAQFFYEIFGELTSKERIWIMANNQGYTYNQSFTDTNEALSALCTLRSNPYNFYFSPTTFTSWRTDKNAAFISCIFIDIDGIDVDFSAASDSDIKKYLVTTYRLSENQLPNWVTVSGHGLHLYYLIDKLNLKTKEDNDLRIKYTNYLLTYFSADVACRNKSRILRFPTSLNVKDIENPKQTRLIHLNTNTDRSIERLDCFAASQDEIDIYIRLRNRESAKKRAETMRRNKTLKTATQAEVHSIDSPISVSMITTQNQTHVKLPKFNINLNKIIYDDTDFEEYSKINPVYDIAEYVIPQKIICNKKIPLYKKGNQHLSRNKCILNDLHNYAARRNGVDEGHRAIFTHIYASFLKQMHSNSTDAYERIKIYLDEDFFPEAQRIIDNLYKTNTVYNYSNKTIAQLLNYDSNDISNSFANYTDEQKKASVSERNKRHDAKRYSEKRSNIQLSKENEHAYIQNHWNDPISDIAAALNCSIRKIEYIRSDIRKSLSV